MKRIILIIALIFSLAGYVQAAPFEIHGGGGGGTGNVATDAIWDTKGDLAVGSGANTAAKLAIGAANSILYVNTDTPGWTLTPSLSSLTLTAASSLVLGTQSSAAGSVILHNATNNNHVTLLSGVTGTTYTLTLPTAVAGGADYLLNSSAAGALGYTDPATFFAKALLTEQGDVIYASAASTPAALAHGTAGQLLRTGGNGANPAWSTNVFPNTGTAFILPVFTAANTMGELAAVGGTGKVLQGVTGAIPAWSTSTYADTYGIGTILHASAANTVTGLATGTAGMLLRSAGAGAAPAWSTYTLADPGAAGAFPCSGGANDWLRCTTIASSDSAAQFYNVAAPTKLVKVDPSGVTAGQTATLSFRNTASVATTFPVQANYSLGTAADGATTEVLVGGGASTLPVWTTASGTGAPARVNTPTLITPIIGVATGTSLALTGNLTGLLPSRTLSIAEGTHDGGDDQATLHDTDAAFTASEYIGMTVYNINDGSSCVVTANDTHTLTCTLAGGTGNDWDDGDVWKVAPGPSQAGMIWYISVATTILHPATAGYSACYMSDVAGVIKVDPQSDSMVLWLPAGVVGLTAGNEIDSAGAIGNYVCIHNQSATKGRCLGASGVWADGGAS